MSQQSNRDEEPIEVEAERLPPRDGRGEPSGHRPDPVRRLMDALGPLAGGVILDLVDLATFGPIGIYVGWAIGAFVGWWLSSYYRLPPWSRVFFAVAAAAYVATPATSLIPLATVLAAVSRFLDGSDGERGTER